MLIFTAMPNQEVNILILFSFCKISFLVFFVLSPQIKYIRTFFLILTDRREENSTKTSLANTYCPYSCSNIRLLHPRWYKIRCLDGRYIYEGINDGYRTTYFQLYNQWCYQPWHRGEPGALRFKNHNLLYKHKYPGYFNRAVYGEPYKAGGGH